MNNVKIRSNLTKCFESIAEASGGEIFTYETNERNDIPDVSLLIKQKMYYMFPLNTLKTFTNILGEIKSVFSL